MTTTMPLPYPRSVAHALAPLSPQDAVQVERDAPAAGQMLNRIAQAMRDPNAYQAQLATSTIPELADEYAGLETLLFVFERFPSPMAAMLEPTIIAFRDMSVREATRRGLSLAQGDDPETMYWMILIAAHLKTATGGSFGQPQTNL